MGIVEAIALGILQGATEFLPVSSSGHLALAQYFLGLRETPVFFDVMLHVGTLTAVLAFYGPALWRVANGSSDPDADRLTESGRPPRSDHPSLTVTTLWFLILATVPAGCAGLAFRPTKLEPGQSLESVDRSWAQKIGDIREYASDRPWPVLGALTVTGGLLLIGSACQGGQVDSQRMRWTHVMGVGIAQAFSAVFPGMSRSGTTISASMALGLRPEWAVHFSLLMSIPAIVGAAVLKARDVDPQWLTQSNLIATAVGAVVAGIVGYYCIGLLLRAVRRGQWRYFTVYVWSLAAFVATLLLR